MRTIKIKLKTKIRMYELKHTQMYVKNKQSNRFDYFFVKQINSV